MGTRADFYIGRGKKAIWIGSIAMDGYPDGIPNEIFEISNEDEFRNVIKGFILGKDDGILPKAGWPWPWIDSRTTDYSYSLYKGRVWASCFGNKWFDPINEEPEYEEKKDNDKEVFPDMTNIQNVAFGKKSGLLIVRANSIVRKEK